MQEKTGHAKETDITAVLVITFTVLVAILIAKVAGDFTNQSISTSTRAAGTKCIDNKPLGDNNYISAGDWCEVDRTGINIKNKPCANGNAIGDFTGSNVCGVASKCCRSLAQISVLGAQRCERETKNIGSICGTSKQDCNNKGYKESSTKCAYASTAGLMKGVCCLVPLPSPTPNPLPVILSATQCGSRGVNCPTTFNDSVVECIGIPSKAWCAYKVPNSNACITLKYAYPITSISKDLSPYCYKNVVEAPIIPQNSPNESYYCSMALTPVTTSTGGTLTTESQRKAQCATLTAPLGHPYDR